MTPTAHAFKTDADAISQGREINPRSREMEPAGWAYVGVDDVLLLNAFSSEVSQCIVEMEYRIMRPDGSIIEGQEFINVVGGSAFATFRLPECFIMSIGVNGFPAINRTCFVSCGIERNGITLGSIPSYVLVQGYVSASVCLSWPLSLQENYANTVGGVKSLTGTTPAAGANWSVTVPGAARWIVKSIYFSLTTSAVVGSRNPSIIFDDGVSILMQALTNNALAASSSATYSSFSNSASLQAQGLVLFGLPLNVSLTSGYRVRSSVFGLQAGDQLSAPQILAETWVDL